MANITLKKPLGAYTSLYRLSIAFLMAIFLTILSTFGTLIYKAYKRYCSFESKALSLKKQVQLAEERVRYKETYIYKLEQDEAFLEKVLRERLGYSTSNDLIFRFENKSEVF